MNITINHRKIIKYINKHHNISFKTLSKKFDKDILKVILLELWANDYIKSSHGNDIINSHFEVDLLGKCIVSEDYFTYLERLKDRALGFVMGVISSIIVYVITKGLI